MQVSLYLQNKKSRWAYSSRHLSLLPRPWSGLHQVQEPAHCAAMPAQEALFKEVKIELFPLLYHFTSSTCSLL